MIASGGPTHTHMSPTVAAGMKAISTVGAPGPTIGPPTCGIGGTPGVTIGQTCMSVSRAAGGMACSFYSVLSFRSSPFVLAPKDRHAQVDVRLVNLVHFGL